MSTAKPRTVSLQEAARLLGKHRNSVSAWIAEGAPVVSAADRPRGIEWQLDLGALLDWHVRRAVAAERERLQAKHAAESERLRLALEQADGTVGPISRPEALRCRAVAESRLAELDLLERERGLAPIGEVSDAVGDLLRGVRDRLQALPYSVAPELAAEREPGRCYEILDRYLRDALVEIACGKAAANRVMNHVLGPPPEPEEKSDDDNETD